MQNTSHPETGKAEPAFAVNESLRSELREFVTRAGLTKAAIARKLGYSPAVGSLYLADGPCQYSGDIAKLERKVDEFLRNEARRRVSGVETAACESSDEIRDALENIRKTNDVGAIVAESGEGKTRGIELYRQANPLTILYHVRTWTRYLASIEGALFEAVGNAGYNYRTKRAVFMVSKLRGTDRLIIVDDAHKLTRPALQFLFDFHEETGCPLGLVGTFELDDLLEDDAQRFSRVGLRYDIKPANSTKLIEHLIKTLAPGVNGEAAQIAALCETVAAEHGHYRSVHKQLKLAAEIKEGKPKTSWVDAFKAAHTMLIRKYAL